MSIETTNRAQPGISDCNINQNNIVAVDQIDLNLITNIAFLSISSEFCTSANHEYSCYMKCKFRKKEYLIGVRWAIKTLSSISKIFKLATEKFTTECLNSGHFNYLELFKFNLDAAFSFAKKHSDQITCISIWPNRLPPEVASELNLTPYEPLMDATQIQDLLNICRNLKTLQCDATFSPEELVTSSNLRRLDLMTDVNSDSLIIYGNKFPQLEKLTSLEFNLTDDNLFPVIKHNFNSLKELNCSLLSTGCLQKCLDTFENITSLYLSGELQNKDLKNILLNFPNLESLELSKWSTREAFIKNQDKLTFEIQLPKRERVKKLILHSTLVTELGLERITEIFPNLETFYLLQYDEFSFRNIKTLSKLKELSQFGIQFNHKKNRKCQLINILFENWFFVWEIFTADYDAYKQFIGFKSKDNTQKALIRDITIIGTKPYKHPN